MCEKATLYLATGAEEFWIVDANQKNVTVVGREGSTVYGIGESIQLPLFGSTLAVTEIFA
jgi:Uma2 family endonuclease